MHTDKHETDGVQGAGVASLCVNVCGFEQA